MENNSMISTSFQVFGEARVYGEHTDLTLRAHETEFQVHKIIMCACSPYFRALVSHKWNSTVKPTYNIQGVSPDMLHLIIQYAYTRSSQITERNVVQLLVAADQFLISGLLGLCCQFLEVRLHPENCIGVCILTRDFYSCSELHYKSKRFVLEHFEKVLQVSEEFLELSVEQLIEIIEKDELNVTLEEVVFEAILHWISYAPDSRKIHMTVLLPKYFVNNVKYNPLVLENEACTQVILNAMATLFEFSPSVSAELVHQLTRPRLPNAILLAVGGWISGPTSEIEAYDMRADCWITVTKGREHPRAYLGTAVLEEYLYCVGGYDTVEYFNSVRKFNLVTQTWHEVAPMYERRCYVSVAVLDGLIYAIGGLNGHRRLKSAERYNPSTNQWTLAANMNERRSDASATSLHGKVYVCGGFTGNECLFSAESFDPQTNQWTLIASMSSRRSGVGVVAYNDLVFAVGGFDGIGRLRSVEAYDPLTNIWTDVASMLKSRSNFGIEVVDDQLFAVGGFDGTGTTYSVECYDVQTNEWSKAKRMTFSRSAVSCCVVSGLSNVAQYTPQRDDILTQEDSDS
ncbi:hypothetical protein DNTS_016207 [Danionella cerebrum]|uniref:BTB domain-containing protein n=1 Tax=Danionella cerebrum TaxID=2873325 RepID=A0A553Q0J8_9TELE|nr:hypothetical protein DNTS_016207 [Danionella translucida]